MQNGEKKIIMKKIKINRNILARLQSKEKEEIRIHLEGIILIMMKDSGWISDKSFKKMYSFKDKKQY